jgi:hypothetical protein
MNRARSDRPAPAARRRLCLLAGALTLAAACVLLPAAAPGSARPLPPAQTALEPVILPGFSYTGIDSCAECHDQKRDERNIGDECKIFRRSDPHDKALASLTKDPKSAEMARGLSIPDAATSPRCLSCHGMSVPEAQRGEKFRLDDGVGCEACHGPAQKWLTPHEAENWTNDRRTELGQAGLLAQFGMRDTRDLVVRTRNCVACHLQIDRDLIDHGHPPLQFEPWSYGTYTASRDGKKKWKTHWEGEDSAAPERGVQVWAVGQFVAAEAASAQMSHWQKEGWDTTLAAGLERVYRGGRDVAAKHLGVAGPEAAATVTVGPAAAAAAAADLAALAAQAGSAEESRILMRGVQALATRACDGDKQRQEELSKHIKAAEEAIKKGEHAAFVTALRAAAAVAEPGG